MTAALLDALEDETAAVLGRFDRRLAGLAAGNGHAEHGPLLRSLADIAADPGALQPPQAVVPRLAYLGRVTLIAGREKRSGKSTLLTAGAAAVTRGGDFLGEPCVGGPVLWVSADQEAAADLLQRARRFHAREEAFHVLWPRDPFADLMAALDAVSPVLLVLDTLANFARVDDPHSSAEWPRVLLPLVQVARERAVAVGIAHHANKSPEGGYRDSTAIGATVDLILEVTTDAASPARRNLTALGRWPLADFAVELVGDAYRVVAADALSLDAQLVAFIVANPHCSRAAVRGVGGRHEDVDRALSRLLASGTVRNDGTDRRHAYVVASDGQTTAEVDDAPPF